jgi:AcrR family transcriptional regulator
MPRVSGNARGRASRARLLEAAAVCFGRDGYAATRISDIAAEAGMSPAGFYRHFPDKQALLFEALREPLAALLAATGPLTDHSEIDPEAVRARNTEFFAVYAAHRRVLRVLREIAALHEEGLEDTWLSIRREFVDRIRAWLHSLVRAGRLHTSDTDVLADALGGVLEQLAYTRLGLARTEPSRAEIEALGRVSAEIWVAALTRPAQ